jgi:hypothetical protein
VAADQKGARAKSGWLVFFDESAISLIPPVRRTWSPRGTTPILHHRMAWKKASMAAALGYWPDATKARLCFHLQQDSYDTDALIGVLEQLEGFYANQQVVLLWDGLSSHWSYKIRAHLDKQCAWLQVERLPAYAPELNPVEYLWANLKSGWVCSASAVTTTPARSRGATSGANAGTSSGAPPTWRWASTVTVAAYRRAAPGSAMWLPSTAVGNGRITMQASQNRFIHSMGRSQRLRYWKVR